MAVFKAANTKTTLQYQFILKRMTNGANKAWETRKKKYSVTEISDRARKNAIKAWPTIRNSEKEFLNQNGVRDNEVISHNGSGMPDYFCFKNDKLILYEIKPKNGSNKQTKLNSDQVDTIKKIIKFNIAEVFLVQYEKVDKNYKYEEIRLTLDNLSKYSFGA